MLATAGWIVNGLHFSFPGTIDYETSFASLAAKPPLEAWAGVPLGGKLQILGWIFCVRGPRGNRTSESSPPSVEYPRRGRGAAATAEYPCRGRGIARPVRGMFAHASRRHRDVSAPAQVEAASEMQKPHYLKGGDFVTYRCRAENLPSRTIIATESPRPGVESSPESPRRSRVAARLRGISTS